MTDYEMNELTKNLIGNEVSDGIITAYITLAKNSIMSRLYPYGVGDETFPTKYEITACELASRYYARRGAEGEITHTENDITRTYNDTNDNDILGRIVPYIKVV